MPAFPSRSRRACSSAACRAAAAHTLAYVSIRQHTSAYVSVSSFSRSRQRFACKAKLFHSPDSFFPPLLLFFIFSFSPASFACKPLTISAYLRTHATQALKEAVCGNVFTSFLNCRAVSAYLRTYEPHALKAAVCAIAPPA
jgi:hypothetical protein